MPAIDVDETRKQVAVVTQQIMANENLDLFIVGALLGVVVLLSLFTIWRGRARRNAAPIAAPSNASGFRRWLTPMGMKSIPAEQAVVTRPRRKSGSNKTIRVSTPVSKVPARALKARGADALDIARRSGLSRDAVVMMMANADPQAHAKRTTAAKSAPAAQPAQRGAATERGMTAPGAYAGDGRAAAPTKGRVLGTQFNARIG